jgi:hypothetical protein
MLGTRAWLAPLLGSTLLLGCMVDEYTHVRQAEAAGDLTTLGKMLRKPYFHEARLAAEAIWRSPDPQAVVLCRAMVHHYDEGVRAIGAKCLAERAATNSEQELVPLLQDPSAVVRVAACSALGSVPLLSETACRSLAGNLTEQSGAGRLAAAEALARHDDYQGLSVVLPAVKDPLIVTKLQAVGVAGLFPSGLLLAELEEACNSEAGQVRSAATTAAASIRLRIASGIPVQVRNIEEQILAAARASKANQTANSATAREGLPISSGVGPMAEWLRARRSGQSADSAKASVSVSTGARKVVGMPREPRMALVIGNAAYQDAPLRNTSNDARAIATALRNCGFNVDLQIDCSQRQMEDAIREFGHRIPRAGLALFYYAGHAAQVDGRNYLVPVGADVQSEGELKYAAVDAGRVLDAMEAAGNLTSIIVLDACRNNPFARSYRSATRGLARMDAPKGSLLAYSTQPGSVASDGTNEHGLYTSMLLNHIEEPGVPLVQLFQRVGRDVREATSDAQVPWISLSLTDDVFLVPAVPEPHDVALPSR